MGTGFQMLDAHYSGSTLIIVVPGVSLDDTNEYFSVGLWLTGVLKCLPFFGGLAQLVRAVES